jgi:hypothetical protein
VDFLILIYEPVLVNVGQALLYPAMPPTDIINARRLDLESLRNIFLSVPR